MTEKKKNLICPKCGDAVFGFAIKEATGEVWHTVVISARVGPERILVQKPVKESECEGRLVNCKDHYFCLETMRCLRDLKHRYCRHIPSCPLRSEADE